MSWHAIFSDRMDHPLQGRVAWIYDEPGTSVAVVTEEGDANLIAAAPDLLAALDHLSGHASTAYSMCATHEEWMQGLRDARAAIAKARGEAG
jgi:hypothetical protein